jgi:hypothetical protein
MAITMGNDRVRMPGIGLTLATTRVTNAGMRRVAWLVGLLWLGLGCGVSKASGSDGSSGGMGPDTNLGSDPTPEEIAKALARVYCHKIFACCETAEWMRQFQTAPPKPTDEASCVDIADAYVSDSFVVQKAKLVATGLMEFHPELADACLTEMAAVTCEEWLFASNNLGYSSPLASCAGVFRGLVPVGGDCSTGGDHLCESGHCDSIHSPVVCLPTAGPGEVCKTQPDGPGLRCRSGLLCQGTLPQTCQVEPFEGRECNGRGN